MSLINTDHAFFFFPVVGGVEGRERRGGRERVVWGREEGRKERGEGEKIREESLGKSVL